MAHWYQQPCGFDPDTGSRLYADRDSPVLALGGAGSLKSSGVILPAIFTAYGGFVAVSARQDLYMAGALLKSRSHEVYSLLSEDLPGATELRWSPLQGCEVFSYAEEFAIRWVNTLDVSQAGLNQVNEQGHFQLLGATLLGVFCYFAAHHGRSILWVKSEISSGALKDWQNDLLPRLRAMAASGISDAGDAADALVLVLRTDSRERSGFITTAVRSLDCYKDELAKRSQEDADTDVDALVRGIPDARSSVLGLLTPGLERWGLPPIRGRYPAIFIASGDASKKRQVIINEFLYRLKEAAAKHAGERELLNLGPPTPFRFCLDELKRSAISDLPAIMSDGRDRGIEITGATQSLAPFKAMYGEEGSDALNWFRTALVMRGLKNRETIDFLSELGGMYDHEVHGLSETGDKGNWNMGVNYTERRNFNLSQVAQGHPYLPDAVMMLDPQARTSWVNATPYYVGMWAKILINSAEHAFADGLTNYPLPSLSKYSFEHLNALVPGYSDRFRALQRQQ